MQRIRETFRKRQSTLDSPESSHSSRDTGDEKGLHSEPSSPKSNALARQRAPPLEHLRQQLKIPVVGSGTGSTAAFGANAIVLVDTSKQLRSVSFDEIRPRDLLPEHDSIAEEGSQSPSPSLEVPGATSSKSARSKSFDSATAAAQQEQQQRQHARPGRAPPGSTSFLEIPKWKMFVRRSSAGTPGGGSVCPPGDAFLKDCVHCNLLEQFLRGVSIQSDSPPPTLSTPSLSTIATASPLTKVSVSSEGSQDADCEESESEWFMRSPSASGESIDDDDISSRCTPSPIPLVILSVAPDPVYEEQEDLGSGVTVISLEVPVLPKSGRSASVDSAYLQVPKRHDIGCCEAPPGSKNIRSRSVDIALPVGPDGPYIVVPNEKPLPIVTQ